ncbi:MAG: porin family protein, partial [Vibrio sp.]
MRHMYIFTINALLLLFSPLSVAEWMVTPFVGYTLGG